MPCLHVAGGQLLQKLAAEMRDDVALDQPGIAFRRLGRDRAGGLPLLEAGANVLGDRELARIDVTTIGSPRQQPGELGLRLAPRALERAIDDVAAALFAWHV